MNICEAVKNLLESCPFLKNYSAIGVDSFDNKPGGSGIMSLGDELLSENIVGDQTRRHSFVFYACAAAYTDEQRAFNTGMLYNTELWLKDKKGQPVQSDDGNQGKITKISTANAMAYEVQDETCTNGITYQIQIYAEYTLTEKGA